MKKLILIALILLPIAVLGQTVTNVRFEQKGDRVYIYYHLDKEANIDIYISMKGNSTDAFEFRWLSPSELEGDIGFNVKAGNKLVIWDALKSNESVIGSNVCFKVVPSESQNTYAKRIKEEYRRTKQLARSNNRSTRLSNYYQANGRLEIGWFTFGFGFGGQYSMEYPPFEDFWSSGVLDLNAFNVRWKLFEIRPINFELVLLGGFTWSYQPSLRVYIPSKNPFWSFYLDVGIRVSDERYYYGTDGSNRFFAHIYPRAEIGSHWKYQAINGDIYFRYDGGFTIGATFGFASHWKEY